MFATVAVAQTTPATFSVSATPSNMQLAAGGAVSYTVTVTSQGGFDQPVTLSVGGPATIPAYVTFAPRGLTQQTGLVTPGATPVTATLTLTSQVVLPVQSKNKPKHRMPWPALAGGATLALLVWPVRRRRIGWPVAMLALAAMMLPLSGCGSSHTQLYNVVVVGTSGEMTQTATVQVNIHTEP